MAPFSGERKNGKIKDRCMLCSTPVYESESGVDFLGLWVHLSCYRRENESSDPESTSPTDFSR